MPAPLRLHFSHFSPSAVLAAVCAGGRHGLALCQCHLAKFAPFGAFRSLCLVPQELVVCHLLLKYFCLCLTYICMINPAKFYFTANICCSPSTLCSPQSGITARLNTLFSLSDLACVYMCTVPNIPLASARQVYPSSAAARPVLINTLYYRWLLIVVLDRFPLLLFLHFHFTWVSSS